MALLLRPLPHTTYGHSLSQDHPSDLGLSDVKGSSLIAKFANAHCLVQCMHLISPA